jgi:hypothetical protein
VFRTAHGDVAESTEVTLVRDHFRELPDHVRLLLPETRISTRSLYEFADYGVTVRGTAGMEMACFGKAVFTAGTGAYSGLGFTTDSASVEEYLDRLSCIQEYGPLGATAQQRARRYVHALFVRRPWAARSFRLVFDFPESGWNPLDRNVEWAVPTVRSLHDCGDLDAWASWVLNHDSVDYLEATTTVG